MTLKDYRKWTVVMASLVLGFVPALLGRLSRDFADIVMVAVSAFAAANFGEHWAKTRNLGGGDAG